MGKKSQKKKTTSQQAISPQRLSEREKQKIISPSQRNEDLLKIGQKQINKQEDKQLIKPSQTSTIITGIFGLTVGLFLIINQQTLKGLFQNTYQTNAQLERLILISKVFGPTFFYLTFMAIFGRFIYKTYDPVKEEEKGPLLAANLLFRHSITHLLIFCGFFFKYAEIENSQISDFRLKQFLIGYVAYIAGSTISELSKIRGLQSLGYSLMIGTEIQLASTLFPFK